MSCKDCKNCHHKHNSDKYIKYLKESGERCKIKMKKSLVGMREEIKKYMEPI